MRRSYLDAGVCITAQLVAQAAKGDAEDLCCVSSVATAGSERENDILSYCVGEWSVVFYDHDGLIFSWHRHARKLNRF